MSQYHSKCRKDQIKDNVFYSFVEHLLSSCKRYCMHHALRRTPWNTKEPSFSIPYSIFAPTSKQLHLKVVSALPYVWRDWRFENEALTLQASSRRDRALSPCDMMNDDHGVVCRHLVAPQWHYNDYVEIFQTPAYCSLRRRRVWRMRRGRER